MKHFICKIRVASFLNVLVDRLCFQHRHVASDGVYWFLPLCADFLNFILNDASVINIRSQRMALYVEFMFIETIKIIDSFWKYTCIVLKGSLTESVDRMVWLILCYCLVKWYFYIHELYAHKHTSVFCVLISLISLHHIYAKYFPNKVWTFLWFFFFGMCVNVSLLLHFGKEFWIYSLFPSIFFLRDQLLEMSGKLDNFRSLNFCLFEDTGVWEQGSGIWHLQARSSNLFLQVSCFL